MENELALIDDFEVGVLDALGQVQSGITNPQQWLVDMIGGHTSSSGVKVGVDQALGLPAVWNSINLIAGHIAAMPLKVCRRTSLGAEDDTSHPAHRVLNVRCNTIQTPFTMKQTTMAHALLQGNGRMWINRNGLGQPTELIPMLPYCTTTVMLGGEKIHYYSPDPNYHGENLPYISTNNTYSGGTYIVPDSDVLHIPGLGYNGLWGWSLLDVARDVFGLDGAGLESQSYAFNNGGRPGLLLLAPKGQYRTYKEAEEFMAHYRRLHKGIDKTGRTALLRDGMTAQAMDPAPMDESLMALRQFSQKDIALLMGTEYLLGESSAVYKDLSDRMSAYVTNTLNKWMETWEQECWRKLLSYQQQQADSHFFKMDASSLLRGSPNALAEYTGQLRQQAVVNQNEVRRMHGLNEVPGLDSYDNPNTSSGAEESNDEEEQSQEEERPDALAQNFKTLIRYESREVVRKCTNDSPMDKLTKFYELYEAKLADLCAELDLPRWQANKHVEESKRQVLGVMSVTDPGNEAESIHSLDTQWEERAKELNYV